MSVRAIEYLHILAAIVMVGTTLTNGLLRMHVDRTDDPRLVAYVSRVVVLFDLVLMLPSLVLLPITGIWLAVRIGYPLDRGFAAWAEVGVVVLFLLFGPGVWVETKLLRVAESARGQGVTSLPAEYWKYSKMAMPIGFSATALILGILYLMVFRWI